MVSRARKILSMVEQEGEEAGTEELYKVFVFETLMNKMMRAALLGRDVEYFVDQIDNYKEISVDTEGGENYDTIIPAPTQFVKGQVLLVNAKELGVLDSWEDQYTKQKFLAKSGEIVVAYVVKPEAIINKGDNTEYELDPNDSSMIQAAKDLNKEIIGTISM